MNENKHIPWQEQAVTPEIVFKKIEPGMSIFVGTGVAEPRTLVKHLMAAQSENLRDLELIQLVSLGEAISPEEIRSQKYRLRTFYSGWVVSEAITEGRVDLIPSRFSSIPGLIEKGQIPVDVAFVQVTPPNEAGYCSLGVALDAARQAMERASLVVGEINPALPFTFGDTFVSISEFDYIIKATEDPLYFSRWPVDDIFDKVGANVASVIEDGSCLAFSIGPFFEALSRHLIHKRNLGIHSPFVTDALMDLIKSGAVSNRYKEIFKGKTLAAYVFGTKELMQWLDRNPLVEFQSIDNVFSPTQIGKNPRFICALPARKVDLSGNITLHIGKGNVIAGPGEAMDFVNGAELSSGGMVLFALPSRNLKGEPNILISVENLPNIFSLKEAIDMVVTEYGVASLKGRSVRERAQALIDITHPEDRQHLVDQAIERGMIYKDQIFLAESAHLYPAEVATKQTFKNGLVVRFRAIKPSDEEGMRRLFYRFSDEAVYYRYFCAVKAMPHSKMQDYVNIDYRRTLAIVGLVGEPGKGTIVAEGRFVKHIDRPYGDLAFVVDEAYQKLGIATFMYKTLIQLAKERGLQGFTADVLATNKSVLRVLEKGGMPVKAHLEGGIYAITIPFNETVLSPGRTIQYRSR